MTRFLVPDVDLDSTIEFEDVPLDATGREETLLSPSWVDLLLSRFPVGRTMEAMVAECIGQSMIAGLNKVESLQLAARVFHRRRIGIYLREAAFEVETGRSVYAALKETNPRASANFLEAIRVGGERGQLEVELRAVARRLSPQVGRQLTRWTGRSKQAIQFAGTLCRLLKDHRLDATVVEDAGRIAASDNKRFLNVMALVAQRTEDGDSLAQALHRFPSDFDPMFIRFVDVACHRSALRTSLNLLASSEFD